MPNNAPVSLAAKDAQYSMCVIHGALITVQLIFGIGSVVGKLGVSSFNPVLFALIREGCAGPILLVAAWIKERTPIDAKDIGWFLLAGFCLFGNQLGFIVGEKLASATIGSAWQPTQPIFAAAIALMLGWERPTMTKISGILVAFLGAAFMVCTDPHVFGKIHIETSGSTFWGNVLFFFNCLGTALYVILSRKLLQKYPSMTVTGWSYIFASLQMTAVAMLINTSSWGIKFVCPPDPGTTGPSCDAWSIPVSAIAPLVYWILFTSVAAYLMLTWANQFAEPSTVVSYTALQPLSSSLLTCVLLALIPSMSDNLEWPGYNLLGGLVILAGLFLILYDGKYKKSVPDFEAMSDMDQAFLSSPKQPSLQGDFDEP